MRSSPFLGVKPQLRTIFLNELCVYIYTHPMYIYIYHTYVYLYIYIIHIYIYNIYKYIYSNYIYSILGVKPQFPSRWPAPIPGRPGLSGSWITQKPSFAKASTAVAVNWARDSMLPGCLVVGGAITILKNSQWVKDDIPYMKNIQFMFETTNQMSTNLSWFSPWISMHHWKNTKKNRDVSLSSYWLNLTWFIPQIEVCPETHRGKNGVFINFIPQLYI